MELFKFTQTIKELCDYYERKEPKQGSLELWFDKVKSVPNESLPWIVKKICQENERFPNNLPGTIYALYMAWREAYPEKVATQRVIDCPDCHEGTIRAYTRQEGRHADSSYLFRCGKCRQSNVSAWPMQSLMQLKTAGYDCAQKKQTGIIKSRPMQSLTDYVVENTVTE